MSFILFGIQHLFTDIDPEHFMEPDIGMQYQKDRQSFDKIAREWVVKYATWFINLIFFMKYEKRMKLLELKQAENYPF